MAGTFHEPEFDKHDYDSFYEDHFFEPVQTELVNNAHKMIPRVRWALEVAQEVKPTTVLDLGCLEGYTLMTLSEHAGVTGVGIDLSKPAIDLATIHADQFKLPVEFHQGKCEDWMQTFIDDGVQFDMIIAFELMEHVEDPDLFRDLMDSLLSKDGSILVSTPAFESPTFGMDDERNKCHVRLYTMETEDYEAVNRYGTKRLGTSMPKFLGAGDAEAGESRIISMDIDAELINVRYR